ncbi:glycosyltransferase family 39 protein [Candidatus Latescibacterota bacterium]
MKTDDFIVKLTNAIQHKNAALTLALFIAVIHFIFLISYFEPSISTPDANGYFKQGGLLATSGRTFFETESDAQHISPHWHCDGENLYYSTYPPGLPAIIAPVYKVFGPKAALLINPVLASLSLLAVFLICRIYIGGYWGVLASALLALNATANQYSLSADSHSSTLFCLVWALYFLVVWDKKRTVLSGFFAGLLLGMIPAIRYPEILFAPAFALFALTGMRNNKNSHQSLLAGVIGFSLPFTALLLRNQLAFGAFWKTGYDFMHMDVGFGWKYFTQYILTYLQDIAGKGVGFMSGLSIAGIAALLVRKDRWRYGLLFILLIVPVTLLYMSYFWSPDMMSMRFLLPTFPVYIIAGVWMLALISKLSRVTALSVSLALLFLSASMGIPSSLSSMKNLKTTNGALAKITETLETHTPRGSLVVADRNIQQNLDFYGHWDLATIINGRGRGMSSRFSGRRGGGGKGGMMPERMLGGNGRRGGVVARDDEKKVFDSFDDYAVEIKRWAGTRERSYLILNDDDLTYYENNLGENDTITVLATIEINPPAPPENPGFDGPESSFRSDGGPAGGFDNSGRRGGMDRGRGTMMPLMGVVADDELLLAEWSWSNP